MSQTIHRLSLAVVMLAAAASPGLAQPVAKTSEVYYAVSGTSAAEIRRQMRLKAPSSHGGKAYGKLQTQLHVEGLPVQTAQGCRAANVRISGDFRIILPRLKNAGRLNSRLRHQWQNFTNFLRRHEQRHIAIYLSCWQKAERQLKALQAPNCAIFNQRKDAIWIKIARACQKQHQALDSRDIARMSRHPLVAARQRRLFGS